MMVVEVVVVVVVVDQMHAPGGPPAYVWLAERNTFENNHLEIDMHPNHYGMTYTPPGGNQCLGDVSEHH